MCRHGRRGTEAGMQLADPLDVFKMRNPVGLFIEVPDPTIGKTFQVVPIRPVGNGVQANSQKVHPALHRDVALVNHFIKPFNPARTKVPGFR